MAKAKRLFYTWKGCFAENVCDVKATDLIEHSIDLIPEARPVMGKVPKYTTAEHAFASEIFPQMKDAGIITRRSSPWGARTKFPPKKKGSSELRVVHNFHPSKPLHCQVAVSSPQPRRNSQRSHTTWIWSLFHVRCGQWVLGNSHEGGRL